MHATMTSIECSTVISKCAPGIDECRRGTNSMYLCMHYLCMIIHIRLAVGCWIVALKNLYRYDYEHEQSPLHTCT